MKIVSIKFYRFALSFAFILSLVTINQSVAQSNFTLMVHGGVSIPLNQLRGTYIFDDSLETSYAMKRGFNIGAEGKINLKADGHLKGVFGINYNAFRRSQALSVFTNDSTSFPVTALPKINILTGSVGLEYNFLPGQRINPYAGLDVTANLISGTGYADSLTGNGSLISLPIKSEFRVGIELNAGIDIIIEKNIGINAGFKYHIADLTKGSNNNASESGSELRLNDNEHINDDGLTIKSKTISYLQYHAGVTFYLGNHSK